MKQWIIVRLLALAHWVIDRYGPPPPDNHFTIPDEVLTILPFAKMLVDRWDKVNDGTSGEYKRDRIYEQIINTHPEYRPKNVHLAILLARFLP